ncbi:hypothetical protein [Aurantibacillus circumpalustris]|uniref:hypothetical protein n=1 Tax=Aurantibacillus circumpalustris TaxID=3036359 RepID=UPI00295B5999|nr:hypothetical protein [Aurantibacillus circumpalustris]
MIIDNKIFIIREEQTFFFGSDEIFLSKICVGEDKYLIELSSRTESIGQRKAHCKRVADGIFKLVVESYKRFDSHEEAVKIWRTVFSYELNVEMVFVLRVIKLKFDQAEIGKMMDRYKFKIKSKIEEKDENSLDAMQIEVIFQRRHIGKFIGTFLRPNFRLELH